MTRALSAPWLLGRALEEDEEGDDDEEEEEEEEEEEAAASSWLPAPAFDGVFALLDEEGLARRKPVTAVSLDLKLRHLVFGALLVALRPTAPEPALLASIVYRELAGPGLALLKRSPTFKKKRILAPENKAMQCVVCGYNHVKQSGENEGGTGQGRDTEGRGREGGRGYARST